MVLVALTLLAIPRVAGEFVVSIARSNALSKKVENHVHSLAFFTTYYNFAKVHSKLRMSAAMAAGVADRLRGILATS